MVKTRFAPSPTGVLHIGSARTALFSWLYAKANDGEFVIRIEDTDKTRSKNEFVQQQLDSLKWLGISSDETLVYQSQRTQIYQKYIKQLLDSGKAYKCYCSKERLDKLKEQAIRSGKLAVYDGHCRNAQEINADYVVRLRVPNSNSIEFTDQIYGKIVTNLENIDDLIIQRTDGSVTYNFAVVVDDHLQKITNVIRGEDHLSNTPKQLLLYQALGFNLPIFCHVPIILGSDGSKLSKRNGSMGIDQLKTQGYIPDALINYIAKLGWSSGDREILTREELVSLFSLQQIQRSPATYDLSKMLWVNSKHLQLLEQDHLVTLVEAYLGEHNSHNIDITKLYLERSNTISELITNTKWFYEHKTMSEQELKELQDNYELEHVTNFVDVLTSINPWEPNEIKKSIKQYCNKNNIKMKDLAMPLRIILTGTANAPDIIALIHISGVEMILSKLGAISL